MSFNVNCYSSQAIFCGCDDLGNLWGWSRVLCLFIDAKGDIHRFVIGKLFTIAIMDNEWISPDDSERVLAR